MDWTGNGLDMSDEKNGDGIDKIINDLKKQIFHEPECPRRGVNWYRKRTSHSSLFLVVECNSCHCRASCLI